LRQQPWGHRRHQPCGHRRLQRLRLDRIHQLALLRAELLHLSLPLRCKLLLLERISRAHGGIDAPELLLLLLLHELLLFELLLLHALAQLKLIEPLRIRRRHATRPARHTLLQVQVETVLQLLLLQPVSRNPGCSESGLSNNERQCCRKYSKESWEAH
jgi:hypothetical protein